MTVRGDYPRPPTGRMSWPLTACLAGILRPASGRITVGDVEVTALAPAALDRYRRGTVGIVFQAFNLVASLSALENVLVPLRSDGVGRDEARRRATEALVGVGLANFIDSQQILSQQSLFS